MVNSCLRSVIYSQQQLILALVSGSVPDSQSQSQSQCYLKLLANFLSAQWMCDLAPELQLSCANVLCSTTMVVNKHE